MKSQGFTLLELLTVIAIIGLLAALGIPVISKNRQRALAVKSLSNVRQIYVAFQSYASDNSGIFPSVTSTDPSAVRWQYKLFPYLMGKDPGPNSSSLLFNTPFLSPGATKELAVKQLGASNENNSYNASYGMNAHLPPTASGPGYDTTPKNPLSLEHYSSTMLLVDCSMSNASLANPVLSARITHGSERYDGKNTVLYCDGHAVMLPVAGIPIGNPASTDPLLQKFWFGH